MRIVAGTLTGLLLCGTLLLAQQAPAVNPPQQPQAAVDAKLEAALANWEKAMAGITTFNIDCERINKNITFSTVEAFTGVARFQKPDKALLYLANKTKPKEFEKYLINNLTFYRWVPSTQAIEVHTMMAPKNGQISDDSFLSFISGMKAVDAKKRFLLTMIAPPQGDTWYNYIEILPLNNLDKTDFQRARLVLTIATGLPRQLWFQEPNGNEVTWDFGKIQTNVPLPPADFQLPTKLDPGWKLQPMAQQPPGPRVVRPQGQ